MKPESKYSRYRQSMIDSGHTYVRQWVRNEDVPAVEAYAVKKTDGDHLIKPGQVLRKK